MTEVSEAEIQEQKPEMVEEVSANDDDDKQKPVFNRIQVSDVVKREQKKAYEKGRREALMELQQQQQQAQPEVNANTQAPAQTPPSSLGGMNQISREDILKMISEQTPQVLRNHVDSIKKEQIVNSFVQKMQAAESKYPGLEEKLNELDYSTIAPLIEMANNLENTGDIMKELVDNPMKMGNLVSLLYTQPRLATKAMQDLSNSIKQNNEALDKEQSAQDPFGQIKPSGNAGMDNGSMSVRDFQKMFRG